MFGPARRYHSLKNLALLVVLRQFLFNARCEFFKDARYRKHRCRLLLLQIIRQVRDRARVDDLGANGKRQVITTRAFKHVRKRQKGEKHVVRPCDAETRAGGDIGADIAVREHHAFGAA